MAALLVAAAREVAVLVAAAREVAAIVEAATAAVLVAAAAISSRVARCPRSLSISATRSTAA